MPFRDSDLANEVCVVPSITTEPVRSQSLQKSLLSLLSLLSLHFLPKKLIFVANPSKLSILKGVLGDILFLPG